MRVGDVGMGSASCPAMLEKTQRGVAVASGM